MWEHYSPDDFKMRSKIALTREESKRRREDVGILCGYIYVGWFTFVFIYYLFVCLGCCLPSSIKQHGKLISYISE